MESFRAILNNIGRAIKNTGRKIISLFTAVVDPITSRVRPHYQALLGKVFDAATMANYKELTDAGMYNTVEEAAVLTVVNVTLTTLAHGIIAGIAALGCFFVLVEVCQLTAAWYYRDNAATITTVNK